MRSGETDAAVVISNDELFQIGMKISELLMHPANMDVDVLERNGEFLILELNARFGGGYPFSHLAGVDLPGLIRCWMTGNKWKQEMWSARTGVAGIKGIVPAVYPISIGSHE